MNFHTIWSVFMITSCDSRPCPAPAPHPPSSLPRPSPALPPYPAPRHRVCCHDAQLTPFRQTNNVVRPGRRAAPIMPRPKVTSADNEGHRI